MNIGLSFDGVVANSEPFVVVKDLFLYVSLLERDEHSVRIISVRTGDQLDIAKQWLVENGSKSIHPVKPAEWSWFDDHVGLEVYVSTNLEELLSLVGQVTHLLFFSASASYPSKVPRGVTAVSNWWELYNHIRYEL